MTVSLSGRRDPLRILYGIQATGNGHIARARVMARTFAQRGIAVDYLLSGREPESLFGLEPFGAFQHRKGLTFDVSNGRVRYLQTAWKLRLARVFRDIAALDPGAYDLVISDFEPVTAWAAKVRGVPSLGISHQCAFNYDIPVEGDNLLARTVMKTFAPVKHAIGLHWDSFGQPILPPLIDLDTTNTGAVQADPRKILVYLPFENVADIVKLLAPLDDWRFLVYMGADPSSSRGNIAFRSYGKESFQGDLASCGGVICNAGFELPSESIHLGKRLLVKPVGGQMEQLSNARALVELGLGHRIDRLDTASIDRWLQSPEPVPRRFKGVAAGIVDWILAGNLDDAQSLADTMWAGVAQGPHTAD